MTQRRRGRAKEEEEEGDSSQAGDRDEHSFGKGLDVRSGSREIK